MSQVIGSAIYAVPGIAPNFAALFSTASTYAVGDYCMYQNNLYKCHTAVSTVGAWTGATNWTQTSVDNELDLKANTSMVNASLALKSDLANLAAAYSTSATYAVGDYCTYNGVLYRCKTAITTAEAWTAAHWEAAKIGNDTRDLKSALESKAEIDGSYEDLTAGNAMQLNSNLYAEDQEPYLFRQTGGSVEAGNREEDCIVGATVAWNQLVKELISTYYNVYDATATFSDGVCTFTPTAQYGRIVSKYDAEYNSVSNHKYLCLATVSDTVAGESINVYSTRGDYYLSITTTTNKVTWASIINGTKDGQSRITVQVNSASDWGTITVENLMLIDLTAMFGSAIADRALALEQATAGSGIAWLKSMGFFTKDYYAYDAGSLQSVKVGAHKTTGKNWLETSLSKEVFKNGNPTVDYGEGTVTIHATSVAAFYVLLAIKKITENDVGLKFTNSDFDNSSANDIRFVVCNEDATVRTEKEFSHTTTIISSDVGKILCLRLYNDSGSDKTYKNVQVELGSSATAYVPYTIHAYPLDTTKEWRGILKLDANNKVYADGDIYPPSGEAQRRYGIVDLGTLTWTDSSYFDGCFVSEISGFVDNKGTVFCARYVMVTSGATFVDKTIYCRNNGHQIFVKDSAYNSAAAFKTGASGVYLVYELATPTSESAMPYAAVQITDADGTEEYTDYAVAAGTRDVAVPVGHQTKYPPDQVKKLDNLPSDLSFVGPIENGATCQNANGYLQGQYFVKNNQFCKTKTSIASGATFTLNTNYEVTTIAAELYAALNS